MLTAGALADQARYYDACADEYAAFADGHSSEGLVGSFLGRFEQSALLADLGCGSGRDLAYLERSGCRVVGLDCSAGLLDQARRRSSAPLLRADMSVLPFADCSLDGLLAIASFHHLQAASQRDALREIARVLKVGGKGLLTAKASPVRVDDVHPRSACVRSFYPVDPDCLEAALSREGLRTLVRSVAVDDRRRAISWVQVEFERT